MERLFGNHRVGAVLLGLVAAVAPVPLRAADGYDRHFEFQTVVVDPADRHVHAPGQDFSVNVTPFLLVGSDLSKLAKVTMTPAFDKAKAENASKADELLFDGKEEYGSNLGVMYDFYFAPPEQHVLTVNIPLGKPATVKYFSLVGYNLNGEYSVSRAEAQLVYTDGRKQVIALPIIQEGSKWRVLMQRTDMLPLSQLNVALSVPYKVNLTELNIRGVETGVMNAHDLSFKAREWLGVNVHAQWLSADGRKLTEPVGLKLGEATTVASPSRPASGYYGLRVEAEEDGMTIYQKDYGFGVMPLTAPPSQTRPDSMFAMVHWDFGDRYLHPAWSKTLTCDYGYDASTDKLDAKGWQEQINWRTRQGYLELPMATSGWSTDASKPVTEAEIREAQTRMEQYFRATPDVLYWELGLEENLSSGSKPYFLSNTEAKAKAVREAAQRVNPKIKLIYQFAGLDYEGIEKFCKSPAAKQFDILSIHPYAWETFPMPDTWEPDLINKTKGWMKESGHDMAIWFTEVGAPHHGNPGGFFGYPETHVYDNGLSRPNYSTYLTRMHVVSASLGVQKLFWYNYGDWGADAVFAERHFGLVDAWGFPKPGYVAYANMVRILEGRKFIRQESSDGLSRYLFEGPNDNCWVIWAPDAAAKPVAIGANLGAVKQVIDNYGGSVAAGKLQCGGSPLYVLVAK